MVSTRRQEEQRRQSFESTPKARAPRPAAEGTPRSLTLPDGRRIRSALKMQAVQRRDGSCSSGSDGDITPRGAQIPRRVRINSRDNMVRVFQSSDATGGGDDDDDDDDGGDSGDEQQQQQQQRRRPRQGGAVPARAGALSQHALALLALAGWAVVSSILIFYNKHVMVRRGFPFPLALPAISQLGCAALAWGAGAAGVAPVRPLPPPRVVAVRLVPLAAVSTLCLGLGNYAYLGLSVAFLNILKAFTPAVTLAISAAAGMERMTPAAMASTLVIAYGTGIATAAEAASNADFHWPSFVAFTTSILFEGARVVLSARLLGGMARPYNPVELLAHIGPMSFCVMSLASAALEGAAIAAVGWRALAALLPTFAVVSVLSFLVNLTSYYAIQLTSSTSFKVVGSFKNAAVVWAGVAMGDVVTARQVQGFALSIAGFVWYTAVRRGGGGGGGGAKKRA